MKAILDPARELRKAESPPMYLSKTKKMPAKSRWSSSRPTDGWPQIMPSEVLNLPGRPGDGCPEAYRTTSDR